MHIHCIINDPIPSNCYIVTEQNSCIIIDPGSKNCSMILEYVSTKGLSIEFIFLTHEHFDHIWGVDEIMKISPKTKVLTSSLCQELIVNPKNNLSEYYDQIGFKVKSPTIAIENLPDFFSWQNRQIIVHKTPGHSNASVSFQIDNAIFTGDLVFEKNKIVTNLPTGNKEKIKQSILSIKKKLSPDTIVYPGHNMPFLIKDIDITLLNK
jgi:hydroxyacylglutathione hydrolase